MKPTTAVAAIQLEWKHYQNEAELKQDLRHFLRLARRRQAQIALLPELTGLMLCVPLINEKQTLSRKGSILGRLLSGFQKNDLDEQLWLLLDNYNAELITRYQELFGALARQYQIWVVGGTILKRNDENELCYSAGIFDATGELVGWQTKFHLTAQEAQLASPGKELNTFEAPFGRFGVLIGQDILFPELSRALAYRGCINLLNPTLAHESSHARRQQLIANTRAQENQIFVAQSFLVGEKGLLADHPGPFMGQSGVYAPFEISPRTNGIQGQLEDEIDEGIAIGMWNPETLYLLWEKSDLPLRQMVRGQLYHDLLAIDYQGNMAIGDSNYAKEHAAAILEQILKNESTKPIENKTLLTHVTPPLITTTQPTAIPSPQPPPPIPRYMPIIDPETGYYLGEKRVEMEVAMAA